MVRSKNIFQVSIVYMNLRSHIDVRNSKTSLMDPRFAPAWVAFAHTFALEGEHDHAVTAYSTCARMFTGYAVLPLNITVADVPS